MSPEKHKEESAQVIPLDLERKKRREKKHQPKQKGKKGKDLLDRMIAMASASEAKEKNRETVNRIDSLFKAHKMSGDTNDDQNLFDLFTQLPGYHKFAKSWFPNRLPTGYKEGQPDNRNTHLNFAEELLERDKLPQINASFWYRAQEVLGDRSMAESVRTFWDEYDAANPGRNRREGLAQAVGSDIAPSVPKRGPGRPPAQPRGGVDSIRPARPLDVVSASSELSTDQGDTLVKEREPQAPSKEVELWQAPTSGGLPSSPLDTLGSQPPTTNKNPYVGREGFTNFYHDTQPGTEEAKFSRPGDSRRMLEQWKRDTEIGPEDLPDGWEAKGGKIELPDGSFILMDMDNHELAIVASKKAAKNGTAGELNVVKRSSSEEANEQLLESEFPDLSTGARAKILNELGLAAFNRKMAQIEGWFEGDDFDRLGDLRGEIGKAAAALGKAQKHAEKLRRGKEGKLEFELAQTEYFELKRKYIEELAREHAHEPDKTERDIAIFTELAQMDQEIEDAKIDQLGWRAGFRKFWNKHPKGRMVVGAVLTGGVVISTAMGNVPGALVLGGAKKAMGVAGAYLGAENMTRGAHGFREQRADKKAGKAGLAQLEALRQSDPDEARQIDAVLQGLADKPDVQRFVLEHMSLINNRNDVNVLEAIIQEQQDELQGDVKSARLGKALGLASAALISGIGLVQFGHEVAHATTAPGAEVGRAAGRSVQEHATGQPPSGPGTTAPLGGVNAPGPGLGDVNPPTTLTREQFSAIYNSWKPDQQEAFNRMAGDPTSFNNLYKILGPNPSADQIANFNNLFTTT